jgi:hypothetical protein
MKNNFAVEIWASTNCAAPGEVVRARATVTNRDSRTQIAELEEQPVLDIIITDQNGEHRWSEGKPLTPDLMRLELKPGESKTIEMEWVVQPLTSSLSITARFLSSPVVWVIIPVSLCPGY